MKITKFIPISVFVTFCVKTMITGIDLASMGAILGLAGLVGFFEYKDSEKSIKDLTTKVDGFQKDLDSVRKSNQDLNTYINAAKVSNVFQGQQKKF